MRQDGEDEHAQQQGEDDRSDHHWVAATRKGLKMLLMLPAPTGQSISLNLKAVSSWLGLSSRTVVVASGADCWCDRALP